MFKAASAKQLKKNGVDNSQVTTDLMSEMDERDQKKCNLVIHNAPELSVPTASKKDSFEFDIKQVDSICKEINVKFYMHDDVKFINRVGAKPSDGRPRPMVVGFRLQTCCDALLASAYRLKKTRLQNIRVVPDLTKYQRKKEEDLFIECERMNANLTPDDSANFLYKVVGRKGQKRMIRVPVNTADPNREPIRSSRRPWAQSSNEQGMSAQPYLTQHTQIGTVVQGGEVPAQVAQQGYSQYAAAAPHPLPLNMIPPLQGQSVQRTEERQPSEPQTQGMQYSAAGTTYANQVSQGARKRAMDQQGGSGHSPPQRNQYFRTSGHNTRSQNQY